jgi:hypothetical protein
MTKEERCIAQFEHMYDKKYEVMNKIAIKELESILAIPETIEIPAKNVALEITK